MADDNNYKETEDRSKYRPGPTFADEVVCKRVAEEEAHAENERNALPTPVRRLASHGKFRRTIFFWRRLASAVTGAYLRRHLRLEERLRGTSRRTHPDALLKLSVKPAACDSIGFWERLRHGATSTFLCQFRDLFFSSAPTRRKR
jgi:hypothetical protein